ncbi:MAG: hypothetical protein ACI9J3_001773 [Parvicellaceae bacterium]|jgi:hypothetical protein
MVNAQSDTSAYKTYVGAQVNLNATSVTGTTVRGINKVGLFAGIFFQKSITDDFALELDLSYSQKGALKPPNHKMNDFTKYLMKLEYGELGVFGRYDVRGVIFEAGLSGGYLISSSETDENNQIITGNGDISKFEFSGAIGVQFPISERFCIGTRLSHSILPIRKHVNGASFRLNIGQMNQVLSFSVRYTILN